MGHFGDVYRRMLLRAKLLSDNRCRSEADSEAAACYRPALGRFGAAAKRDRSGAASNSWFDRKAKQVTQEQRPGRCSMTNSGASRTDMRLATARVPDEDIVNAISLFRNLL